MLTRRSRFNIRISVQCVPRFLNLRNRLTKHGNEWCVAENSMYFLCLSLVTCFTRFISFILSEGRLQRSLQIATSELAVSTRKFYTANILAPSLPEGKQGPRLTSTWGYWVPCCTPRLETRSRWCLRIWRQKSFPCILTDSITRT